MGFTSCILNNEWSNHFLHVVQTLIFTFAIKLLFATVLFSCRIQYIQVVLSSMLWHFDLSMQYDMTEETKKDYNL